MSYFTLSHPNQECGECRGCSAHRQAREKCAVEMYARDESDFQDSMERLYLCEEQMKSASKYIDSLNTKVTEEIQ